MNSFTPQKAFRKRIGTPLKRTLGRDFCLLFDLTVPLKTIGIPQKALTKRTGALFSPLLALQICKACLFLAFPFWDPYLLEK